MGQITVARRNGTKYNLFSTEPLCFLTQAVQNFTLMGEDNVQLSIKSAGLMDFAIGDKIVVGGDEYSVRTKATREMLSEDMYSYEVIFYGVMYELMKSQYRNTDANGKSSRSSFDLTYSLADFVKVIINNVSRDYPGMWRFDVNNCPDTEPKTLQFSKQNCLQVLQTVCKQFDYEFRIDQENGVRIIRVGKFGSVVNPPAGKAFFEWGKGNGLYKLKEQKIDDKSIITRLWVEGGTKNIRSDYRGYSDRLQLPYPKRLNQREHKLSDGTVIPAKSETIGISNDDARYIEDVNLKNQIGSIEDTEFYDDVHPYRTGTVTALGADIYSFVDATMDFDLNEKDAEKNTRWLISGVTAKINFTTGRLAGQQFELKEKGGYDHSKKTFTIIKYTDERGADFPSSTNEGFRIGVGDKYKITDINLPDSYVQSAEEDLWYAGYDDFRDRKQARAQYVLTFDRMYFLNSLPDDSETSVFRCGDYVPVKDERFGIEKNIRIQKMSRNLLVDHDYVLTLSDTTTISIQTQTVLDVLEHNIIIDNHRLRDLNKARLGWRTTEELRNMVYDTDGFFDTGNIRPLSIDTNMLTVGSKSQQFILVDVILQANVNGLPNRFDATAGVLAHLTINENEARLWNMSASSVTLAETSGYYVFAKCSKAGNTGVWYITQQQLKVEDVSDPNNYYFQVGIIGSLHSGFTYRDFTTTYGFTRINGNTITTGRIITSDGQCYLDLDGNKFRIGDSSSSIDWNVTAKNQITLINVKVLSKSGTLANIGVFRGVFSSAITYYPGDEITYTANGSTSTYRQIHPTNPCVNILPTNSTYWAVVAQGAQGTAGKDGSNGSNGSNGSDGDYFEYRYAVNGSTSTPPTLSSTSAAPSGWTTTIPAVGTLRYLWCTIAKKSASGTLLQNWSTPVRITPYDGVDGSNGAKGEKGESPVLVFRGVYDSSKTYYGNNQRLDAVKYNGVYYIARIDSGAFYGKTPTDTSKWNTFGAQFETIATNLLLAEGANIGDWFMSGGKIVSTLSSGDKITLDASMALIMVESTTTGGDYSLDYIASKMRIDARSGVFEARNNNGVAYISPSGIFCNNPKTNALPSSSGYTHYGAVVGLGYANNVNYYWNFGSPDTIVAGVYGRASNSGNAPAFGGYFSNLLASGLILDKKYISDSSGTTYLYGSESFLLGLTNSGVSRNVYLPSDGYEGKIIFAKQIGQGAMRFYPRSGQYIHDDITANDYYDVPEGWMAVFVFVKFYLNSVSREVWTVSKFKY